MKKNEIKFRPQNGLLPLAPTGNNTVSTETLIGNTYYPSLNWKVDFASRKLCVGFPPLLHL